jgi:hypothetical protein
MTDKSMSSVDASAIKFLAAKDPDPTLKEKLMLFGQFVGDWQIVKARYAQSDGTWAEMRGEVHFGWILGGLAVQDVWMGHRVGVKKLGLFGTTVRFYDPKIDAWRSTWLSPAKGIVQLFVGRKVGDTIVLELQNPDDCPERWIFSDITAGSFRWHAEVTRDNGKNWVLTEEMHIQRVV